MESYKNKPKEELLDICKSKLENGRTFEELRIFLNRHEIDNSTQKYIFTELEKYEKEIKAKSVKKKRIPTNPIYIVIGIMLIVLGLMVLRIGNMQGLYYTIALCISALGFIFISIELVKLLLNFNRE